MKRKIGFRYKLLASLLVLNLGFILLMILSLVQMMDTELDDLSNAAVDAQGNLYVVDGSCVLKYNSAFGYRGKWGKFDKCNSGADVLPSVPQRLVGDSQGNLYGYAVVAQDGSSGYVPYIQKFDQDGRMLLGWGTPGSQDGQFAPLKWERISYGVMTVDRAGNVYVIDRDNKRIQKFDSSGNFLAKWGGQTQNKEELLYYPIALGVDEAGNVYVLEGDYVKKFDAKGSLLTRWSTKSSDQTSSDSPFDLAVDRAGNVYVADPKGIQKFDPDGQFLIRFDKEILYSDPNSRSTLQGVVIDQHDNIYTLHSRPHLGTAIIRKYNSAGESLNKFEGSSFSSKFGVQLFLLAGFFGLAILLLVLLIVGLVDLVRRRRKRL